MPMVQRANGDIALQWAINTNGKTIRIGDSDTYYVFTPKLNVVMAWVSPEHVPSLLSHKEKTCNCNNGTYRNAFVYAPLINVNLWMFGNREGSLLSDYREIENT
jgi:hypothetical protein